MGYNLHGLKCLLLRDLLCKFICEKSFGTKRVNLYGGADKSLVWPGRKQATATEDFDVHISYL